MAFSSNSSLCGAFNSNVAKMLERTLENYQSLGKENILIYPVGRKVEEAVKKMGYVPQGSVPGDGRQLRTLKRMSWQRS